MTETILETALNQYTPATSSLVIGRILVILSRGLLLWATRVLAARVINREHSDRPLFSRPFFFLLPTTCPSPTVPKIVCLLCYSSVPRLMTGVVQGATVL